MLHLFSVFHLNLAYSSIEERQRPEVVERCYWPLLRIARERGVSVAIEASGYTLETIAAIDPEWIAEMQRLAGDGLCEFVGSGYAQIIGPLVPAEVNAANLRLGYAAYERLLGCRPALALVNEQAYSSGLLEHYCDVGCRALVMEWDNPAHAHPEWNSEWRFLPQILIDQCGRALPVVWNHSLAFQKFQRYAHGEIELEEYCAYLAGHAASSCRALSLYGNDAEIFDFRPGRYGAEAPIMVQGEWRRIDRFFATAEASGTFRFVGPRDVLALLDQPDAGHRLSLETPDQPIPVKKQGKYNITRWAVTGRDDLGINTRCWRAYAALRENPDATDEDWRELCYLWSSDFRTHITDARWNAYLDRLDRFQLRVPHASGLSGADSISSPQKPACPTSEANRSFFGVSQGLRNDVARPAIRHEAGSRPSDAPAVSMIASSGVAPHGLLAVETDAVRVALNCRRGIAIDTLAFKAVSDAPLCGTLKHGYFDDIRWGADYYTGHVVLEIPGGPKTTDLLPVEPEVTHDSASGDVLVTAVIHTSRGLIRKSVRVGHRDPRVELVVRLEWPELPLGSLRLGHITLKPEAFDYQTLYYRTHNGGGQAETFPLAGRSVDHGAAVSFLVSASHAVGLTEGFFEFGDGKTLLQVEVDRLMSALVGMVTCQAVNGRYFCRLALSAAEVDETRRGAISRMAEPLTCRLVLRAHRADAGGRPIR